MNATRRTAAALCVALSITALSAASVAQSSLSALRRWDTTTAPSNTAQPTTSATTSGAAAPETATPQLRPWAGPPAARTQTTASAAAQPAQAPRRRDARRGGQGAVGAENSAANPRVLRDASGAIELAAMRVPAMARTRDEDGSEEQPIVIEMFASPGVTPYAAPFSTRPFGPPQRPLRLISTYDGDDPDPRVTVTVAPALAILRDYDGEPPQPPEVRVEVVANAPENTLILLPMRVTPRTNP